jgi:Uma2 family endonuclease
MVALRKLPPRRMTIPEFLDWAEDRDGMWQLRDGEPEMMNPPAVPHGEIQGELAGLLRNHLRSQHSPCRVIVTPGVIPHLRSDRNMLVPDLAVSCAPPRAERALSEPVLLVEIMSPSNERQTRANLWAFTTIPSVREILVVSSIAIGAELLRRRPDGTWPEQPEMLTAGDTLALETIGYAGPLAAAYATTHLATAAG